MLFLSNSWRRNEPSATNTRWIPDRFRNGWNTRQKGIVKWRDSIGRVGGEEKIKLGREERVNRLPSRYTIQTRVIDIDVKGVLASRWRQKSEGLWILSRQWRKIFENHPWKTIRSNVRELEERKTWQMDVDIYPWRRILCLLAWIFLIPLFSQNFQIACIERRLLNRWFFLSIKKKKRNTMRALHDLYPVYQRIE